VSFFELLTGGADPRRDGHETLLPAQTEEPVPPGRLRPRLPRDLETVTLRCLEKRPAAPLPSARALADDLGRFSAASQCEPGRSGLERAVKWARRPVLATLTAGLHWSR
jgi:serine/threonine-protein kinase